jgi:hypothetical protein
LKTLENPRLRQWLMTTPQSSQPQTASTGLFSSSAATAASISVGSAASAGANTPGIQLLGSQPAEVKFHLVEDSELGTLGDLGHQWSFGTLTTSAGAFLGLLPTVVPVIENSSETPPGIDGIAFIFIAGGCLVAAIISAIITGRNYTKGSEILRAIRARPMHRLNP